MNDNVTKDQTLNVSQQHLNIALDQVKLGFWELDIESMALLCTPRCKINFGAGNRATFSYHQLLSSIIPEDRLRMQQDVAAALDPSNGVYHSQYRVRHPDGSLHWIEANGRVLFDGAKPHRMVGTTVNITEKKDLELLKDELLSVATHELKTPVSAVKGYLQILHRFVESTDNQKFIQISDRALGATERITRLIAEIADPAHRHLNYIRLIKEEFDLRTLVDEIASNAMLINPDYRIDVRCSDETFMIKADRFRTGQVLTNLITNAVKYSPEHKQIEVRVYMSGNHAKVEVIDQGIGLPEGEHEKVFQKFYRSPNGTKTAGGFGIGLYLSAEIVTRQGGQIGVEQSPEKNGTCFYFTLPINS